MAAYNAQLKPSNAPFRTHTMENDGFYERYKSHIKNQQPKHEALKQVLIAAIEDGHWKDDEKLPTEQVLAKITPFSLGTVQKAIGFLVSEGYVQRKRGQGTFIIPREKRMGEPWIYRVLSPDESRYVPMTTKVLRRVEVESDASWATWLRSGKTDQRIIRLERVIHAEGFSFFSQYNVCPERFPLFETIELKDLDSENFVKLTAEVYRVTASKIMRTVRAAPLPKFATDALGIPPKSFGTWLEVMANSSHGVPIFFHQLYVPSGGLKIAF
jgi:GntR family transcriptional regulator